MVLRMWRKICNRVCSLETGKWNLEIDCRKVDNPGRMEKSGVRK